MAGKIELRVTAGKIAGQVFSFDEHDTLIFGRGPSCHAKLPEGDTTASRIHFILEANPPDARIRDLGSRNGTYINGHKHGGRADHETPEQGRMRKFPEVDLAHGDVISVGENEFVVAIEAPPAPLATTLPDVCAQCGKNIRSEIAGRSGELACADCRSKFAAASPEEIGRLLATTAPLSRPASDGMAGYQIIKQLGQGAMGAVYLATRVRDNAKVAIKVMLASVAIDDHARKLFQREIEVIQNLRHHNIVELFDHGPVSGGFYFAMELCPGGSVGGWLERLGRPLTVAEVGPIALATATGLAYAHEQGFVHRDIKPDNLLMTEPTGGVIKVADFGLAKSFDKAGLSGMTATNAVGGTPLFMAREQIINFKLVKPPADVWSLAATFYWMLSRQPTRDFRKDMDPLLTILTDPVVPLRKRAPAVPQRFADVIDRALADEIAQRFPTMSAFRSALEAAL